MACRLTVLVLLLGSLMGRAAERKFDFSDTRAGDIPPGFKSALSGAGKPGEWRIQFEDSPSAFPALSPKAIETSRRPVLAQVSTDPTDERFPICYFSGEEYADFTFTTKVKMVSGKVEQMAGLVFRYQDPKNYYYIRANAIGRNVRFFKVVNGVRSSELIGADLPVTPGEWHELRVQCKGSQIRFFFNGQPVTPELGDNTFNRGMIGFWTKSDSVSFFTDAHIHFTPRERYAQSVIRQVMEQQPRVLGLKIYAVPPGRTAPEIIASTATNEIGKAGFKEVAGVIEKGQVYQSKGKDSVEVTMPVHDRNGDKVAACGVVLRSFFGQTEKNSMARAMAVVKEVELRVTGLKELLE